MAAVESLSREELIALLLEQQRLIEALRAEIERLKRGQHRPAAPFSKGKPKANPKRPGRKRGKGPFRRREAPAQAPSQMETAEVPPVCPFCGGRLEQEGEETATTTDVPAQPQPVVTLYRIPVCRCQQCKRPVGGTAPGLAPDQYGATAHRMGAGVMAVAHTLHYSVGIPVRRIPAVLRELTGVTVTQSAITQDALRRAEGAVGAAYKQLRDRVREAPVVHTDDTGWRIGGRTAFLMGFDTDQATVYQIRDQHRHEEVRELIPADYAGVMVTDRGKSYDAEEFAAVDQQKCLGHLVRNVSEVVEAKRGTARQFGVKLRILLREGLALWHARGQIIPEQFQTRIQKLDEQLTHHLRSRVLRDDDNQRLLDGIGLQHDRGHVLRFLVAEGVEPTNNRAERILRPAVIARKVSQCSKNRRGAEAFAAFVTVSQTARKTAAQTVTQMFQSLFSRTTPVAAR
ncbi:MAG: IS66 family transposase [Terriglobales bacterium]